MKSSDGRNAQSDKAKSDSGNGRKGKGLNGFKLESLPFDREMWGVTFPGVGAPLPGPGLYDRADPKAKKAHEPQEKGSERPKPEGRHAEFEVLYDGAFVPSEERCAW